MEPKETRSGVNFCPETSILEAVYVYKAIGGPSGLVLFAFPETASSGFSVWELGIRT